MAVFLFALAFLALVAAATFTSIGFGISGAMLFVGALILDAINKHAAGQERRDAARLVELQLIRDLVAQHGEAASRHLMNQTEHLRTLQQVAEINERSRVQLLTSIEQRIERSNELIEWLGSKAMSGAS